MSDKGKARKLTDDRKSVRGQAANLQSLGGGPGMVHHHNYGIPSEGFHSGSHLAYRPDLAQLMNMGPASMSRVNDLGPPIFMPSLNLGTPKPGGGGGGGGGGGVNNMASSSSALTNSKLKPPQQQNMTSSVAFDMMSYTQGSPLSAFHSAAPLKPVQYITHSSSTPPSSIAKPTLICMAPHGKGAVTKVAGGGGGGGEMLTQPAFTASGVVLPKTDIVKLEAGIKGEGLLSQHYGYSPQHGGMQQPIVTTNLSKNLLTSSHQQQILSVSSPGSSGTHTPPGLLNDPYSVHSPVMVPMTPPIPVTSGQPSSISSLPDTRLDRPPHPSAPLSLSGPTPAPGGLTLSKELTQPKDRLTTAEVASNIIISNPGLTGKHIAAMTNTTQQQQPPPSSSSSSFLPLSSYSSPITHSSLSSSSSSGGGGGGGGDPSSGGLGGHVCNIPLTQHHHQQHHHQHHHHHLVGGDTGWGGYSSLPQQQQQHNSDHIFQQHGTLSPVSMATGLGGGVNPALLNHQLNGRGMKSRLDPSINAHPPGVHPLPPDQAMMSPPGQPNSSPRPRILRGKRSLEGNWKLDGPTNSLPSPGSPHRYKLQRSLKNSTLSSPGGGDVRDGSGDDGGGGDGIGSGGGGDRGGGGGDGIGSSSGGGGGDIVPTSPTYIPNITGIKTEGGGGDISGSPRKKPRKQNVVANDDQYATNVPDTHKEEGGALGHVTSDYPNKVVSSTTPHGGGPTTPISSSLPPSKKLEICYLSQLRKSPYVINGVYKLHHHTAHNHFRRYADIKRRELLPLSVYDLANNKTSQYRASAWKLYHFSSQLEETETTENDVLVVMERIQNVLDTIKESSLLDKDALTSTEELIQGNIDRSKRIKSHIESTRTNMFTVLDHRPQVMDILDRHSNFNKSDYSSISPSLSSSSSSHHKSQS